MRQMWKKYHKAGEKKVNTKAMWKSAWKSLKVGKRIKELRGNALKKRK